MLHNKIFFHFPRQNKVPSMPILSQTLKSHNSETVRPFELTYFVHFGQLYQRSTRGVLEIDQSIAINALSMPGLWHQKSSNNLFVNQLGFFRQFSFETPLIQTLITFKRKIVEEPRWQNWIRHEKIFQKRFKNLVFKSLLASSSRQNKSVHWDE
jgi:hypothetical protein